MDTETTGLKMYGGDRVIGISVEPYDKTSNGESYYFPFRHKEGNLDCLPTLIQMMSRRDELRFWHAQFDLPMLWNEGLTADVTVRDVMLDCHLLDENNRSGGLKAMSDRVLGPGSSQAEKELDLLLQSNLLDKGQMECLHPEKVQKYACMDVELTRGLADVFDPLLDSEGMDVVAEGVSEYARVVALMERRGVLVDRYAIPEFVRQAQKDGVSLLRQTMEEEGRKINLGSPKEVGIWLGVEDTDERSLTRWAEKGEEKWAAKVRRVIRYRKQQKAITSYYRKFMNMSGEDGILRSRMLLNRTVTGRMAVTNPPLQALPRDTGLYKVKQAIVARPGYQLVQADYDRAELCLASHYGSESRMGDALASGQDIHQMVADDLGIDREHAKRTNFSIVYGIGADALSENLGCAPSYAKTILRGYHAKYPGFRRLYKDAEEFAKNNHYIRMWTGRRRHFGPTVPFHKASSCLVQGGIAELIRVSQTRLHNELEKYGVNQLIQVHDAAVMEVPEGDVDKCAGMIREIMNFEKFRVPLRVDIKAGDNLQTMKEIKP